MTPQFEHDSDCCKFVCTGKYDNANVDFYLCGDGLKTPRTLIARYGNDGCEYASGELFICTMLTRLDKVALQRGLDLTSLEKEKLLTALMYQEKARFKISDYANFAPSKEERFGSTNWFEDPDWDCEFLGE